MSNYTNYWGKSGNDFVPGQRLIYHCLDVAAVGQVLLQLVLQHDDYEDILTQNITHDKKISQSLITFFVLMHDLGKFSYKFQNMNQDAVKKVHGRLSDKKYYAIDHDEPGFLLCQKVIWLKIWDKNWLGLDQSFNESDWQDVLISWFRAVTMHHTGRSNIDFQNNKLDNLKIYFIDENKKDARNFIEDASKFILNIKSEKPLLEIDKSLDDTYKYTSDLLQYLTCESDQLVSKYRECRKYFNIPRTPTIEQYWTEVLRYAELAVKDAEFDSSEIIEHNQYFFRKRDLRLQGIALINKAKDDYIPNRMIDKAIECYYGAIEFFKKANAEDLLNKYESELRRLELKNDYSLSDPVKRVTLDNLTNKNKISKNHVRKEFDRCLFEILRNLRHELTNGKHHLLFPNESLEAMATSFSQDLESLKKITGTCKNYEKYGKLFLEKIVTYSKVQETNSERCYPTELQETLNLCKQNLVMSQIHWLSSNT